MASRSKTSTSAPPSPTIKQVNFFTRCNVARLGKYYITMLRYQRYKPDAKIPTVLYSLALPHPKAVSCINLLLWSLSMRFMAIIIGLLFAGSMVTTADKVQDTINEALAGLDVVVSDDPYSRTIKRMYMGWDKNGEAKVGVAYREIESFKTITGVVIVHKTVDGFILHEAEFPDIGKIKNAKDRKQVLSVLKQFKGVPFDPHAEKSAVDGLTGATRYGIKTSGYLNYMTRRVALEMESLPEWTKPKNK
jgi:hypothetical protein